MTPLHGHLLHGVSALSAALVLGRMVAPSLDRWCVFRFTPRTASEATFGPRTASPLACFSTPVAAASAATRGHRRRPTISCQVTSSFRVPSPTQFPLQRIGRMETWVGHFSRCELP